MALVDDSAAYREAIGRTIGQLRGEQGWSLRALSERSDISIPYLSEIERGRKEPSGAMLSLLATAFGLTLTEMLRAIAQQLDVGSEDAAPLQQRLPADLVRALVTLETEDLTEVFHFASYLHWRRSGNGA